jgi:glucan phosphoethanolaminetransferase (alkaline phosphatase superfamily)
MFGGMEIITLFLILFMGAIGLLIFAFWIWMIVDAIQNKGLTDGEKVCWVLAVVFLHILGAILYFFIGHPKRHTPLAI